MNLVANMAMVRCFEIVCRKFNVVRIFGTAVGSNAGKRTIKSVINLQFPPTPWNVVRVEGQANVFRPCLGSVLIFF
jgi:hypothetical protein